jgi:hypothetical protein
MSIVKPDPYLLISFFGRIDCFFGNGKGGEKKRWGMKKCKKQDLTP